MNPQLTIDLEKLAQNVRTLTALCEKQGIGVTGVTKACCGSLEVARVFAENGVKALADSRVDNLMKFQELPIEKWLIRTPQPSDAQRTVTYADVSLNSEAATIKALAAAATEQGRTHKVILMYDLGDLREGFVDADELLAAADLCMELDGVELAGIGANLTCLSFIQPDPEKMQELCTMAQLIQKRHNLSDFIISAGNSATIHTMIADGLPSPVNNLRLGESLLLGRERACYQYLPETRNDAFVVTAEVVEAKRKPSKPWGTVGPDSYGVVHEFEDVGEQVRAIVAAGGQDIDVEVMWPVDERVKIVASSSDHTVLDVTACASDYPVGSTVALRCGYHALVRAFTSPYVEKVYV